MSKNYFCLSSRFSFTFLLLFISHLVLSQKISTLAGGTIGDGKPATQIGIALTDALTEGIAIDAADNLYILDMANGRIRKVSAATGIISTYAGNGSINPSGDGGPALNAGLGRVHAITSDRAGN